MLGQGGSLIGMHPQTDRRQPEEGATSLCRSAEPQTRFASLTLLCLHTATSAQGTLTPLASPAASLEATTVKHTLQVTPWLFSLLIRWHAYYAAGLARPKPFFGKPAAQLQQRKAATAARRQQLTAQAAAATPTIEVPGAAHHNGGGTKVMILGKTLCPSAWQQERG